MADHHIAGYRYDAVSKRYFRLINEVTLQPIPVHRKRKKKGHQHHSACDNKPTSCAQNKLPHNSNFTWHTSLILRQMGQAKEHQFVSTAKQKVLTSSKLDEKKFSIVRHYVGYQLRGHSCLFLTTGNDSKHIVGIWKNSNGTSQWTHTFTLDPSRTRRPSRDIWENDFIPLTVSLRRFSIPGLITSCCWANDQKSASILLGITGSPPRQSYGVQYDIVQGKALGMRISEQEPLGNDAVFSCAFSEAGQMMAFGLECSGFIIEKTSTNRFHLPKVNDSFHCMSFSEDGRQLLSGSRKGILYNTDFRSRPSQQFASTSQISDSVLCALELSRNQREVVASGFNNKLFLIDLRMTKTPVIKYQEHRNECRKIPFTVDEDIGVLCSVGQDKITRLWDIHNPVPIKQHNPPSTTLQDSDLPVATFQAGWRGQFNAPVLFVAHSNSIFMYHI